MADMNGLKPFDESRVGSNPTVPTILSDCCELPCYVDKGIITCSGCGAWAYDFHR